MKHKITIEEWERTNEEIQSLLNSKKRATNSFDRMLIDERVESMRNTLPKHKPKRPKKFDPCYPKSRLPFLRTGKYSDYLKTPYWKELRNRAFAHFGRNCGQCGSKKNLQVHHKNYFLFQECWNDLEILCRACHESVHQDKVIQTDEVSRQFRRIVASMSK